jgi:hypothetical protein
MSGWRSHMSWSDGRGLLLVAHGSLGYGLAACAALQLESERRYVGTEAPEGGGLGCLRRAC